MVGCTTRPRKSVTVQFAEPPWDERSIEWQVRDQQVEANHPARVVVKAMKQLDLTPLFALYVGAGLPPIRPDLMLVIALIEIRLGRQRPSQWFRDTRENLVLQWASYGIRPSRTCWYNFEMCIRDRPDALGVRDGGRVPLALVRKLRKTLLSADATPHDRQFPRAGAISDVDPVRHLCRRGFGIRRCV